ncbi:transcriptional regulator, Cro/CI family [Asticcacaulis biprosthecium C19]|uniref:Transcriptional regulator, Cro/CI family n=1 Tax=Asticcacaulis biprosthecium C19 TaxID=715226 RepID=F4QK45_9CAUL|nr:helix-turn-helix domain-containing protein [Asticcacaulis biprosthecium]EGF92072.1 transcriptional regulator, Cro/CI family [Asticcacaulis biprosthecium C19]
MLARRRLSIVELSDRTGISVRDLEILRDQKAMALRLKTLDALCRALHCEPADLIAYGENEVE